MACEGERKPDGLATLAFYFRECSGWRPVSFRSEGSVPAEGPPHSRPHRAIHSAGAEPDAKQRSRTMGSTRPEAITQRMDDASVGLDGSIRQLARMLAIVD